MTALAFGDELRRWRKHRRFTQLDLASEAEVSCRHLSYLENGRAAPSRVMVLTLAEVLDVPMEDTNRLLTIAGFAPAFRARGLDGSDAAPVREALSFLLRRYHPYPAVVVDPAWCAVMSNDAYVKFAIWLNGGGSTAAEDSVIHEGPPVAGINVLEPLFDPERLRARVRNFDEFATHMLAHLRRSARDEPGAAQTLATIEARYPAPAITRSAGAPSVVMPLVLEGPGDGSPLRLFTSMTMFGSSTDTLLSSLRVETFFAADTATDRRLRAMFQEDPRATPT